MRAYHGSDALKHYYVQLAEWHRDADRLRAGSYFRITSKGNRYVCALGCVVGQPEEAVWGPPKGRLSYGDAAALLLGVPGVATSLIDDVFEMFGADDYLHQPRLAADWTVDILRAIPVGADLRPAVRAFWTWYGRTWGQGADGLLSDADHQVFSLDDVPRIAREIKACFAAATVAVE